MGIEVFEKINGNVATDPGCIPVGGRGEGARFAELDDFFCERPERCGFVDSLLIHFDQSAFGDQTANPFLHRGQRHAQIFRQVAEARWLQ